MSKNTEFIKDSERRKLQEDIERLQNVIADDDFNSDEDSDNDNLQIDIRGDHGEGNEDASSRIPSQAGSIHPEAVTIDDRDTEEIIINLNENVPIDPDTCLALNKAYQEVLLDTLRSIEMALIENRDKQSQLQETLEEPRKGKSGEGRSKRTITSYHRPFFMDAAGDIPPCNMDVHLKKRSGEVQQNQRPQNAWRHKMKEELKEAVYTDSLSQQTRHLLNRKEIYFEKLSELSKEAHGEVYDKLMEKIEDIDKEIEKFKDMSKEEMLAMADLDKVDWMKISKTVLNNLREPGECELYWRNVLNPGINRGEFSKEEKKKLQELAEKHGQRNWPEIAKELGTNRTAFQCFNYYQQHLNDSLNKREWTEAEDQTLIEVVESCRIGKTVTWNNVAFYMEGRSSNQCALRWHQINPEVKHGKWTSEEDMKLLSAIYLHGEKWDQVAESVPGRTQVQCRERYKSALDPNLLTPSQWSYEEDKLLLELADKYRKPDGKIGWAKVAAQMPGRTDNHVLFRHRKLMQWKEKCDWLDKQDQRTKDELGYINIDKLAGGDSKRKKIKATDKERFKAAIVKRNEEDYSRLRQELKKLPMCEFRLDYVKQLKDMREGNRVVPRPPLMYRTTRKSTVGIWSKKKHIKYLVEKHLSQLNITNAEDRALIPEKTAEQFSPFSGLNYKQMAKVKAMLQNKMPSEISVREMLAVSNNKRAYTTSKVKAEKQEKISCEIEGRIKEILQYKYCYISRFRKPTGTPRKFYIFYPKGRKPKQLDAENPCQLNIVTSTLLLNALEVDGKKAIEAYNKLSKNKQTQLRSLYDLLCRCYPQLIAPAPTVSSATATLTSPSVPMVTAVPSACTSTATTASSMENKNGRRKWIVRVGHQERSRGRKSKDELKKIKKGKLPDKDMIVRVNNIVQETRKHISMQNQTESSQQTIVLDDDPPGGQSSKTASSTTTETPSRRKRKASVPSQSQVVHKKVPKMLPGVANTQISTPVVKPATGASQEERAAMVSLYTTASEKSPNKQVSPPLCDKEGAKTAVRKRNLPDCSNKGTKDDGGASPAKVQKGGSDTQPLSLPISPPGPKLPRYVPLPTRNTSGGPVPTALVVNAGAAQLKLGQQIVQIAKTNLTGANPLKPGQEPPRNSAKVIVLKQAPGAPQNKFPILPPCGTTLRGYEELLIQTNLLRSRAAEHYNPFYYREKDAILHNRVKPILEARKTTSKLDMDTNLERLEEIDAKRINAFFDAKHPRNYGPFQLSTHPRRDLLKEYRDTEDFIKLKKRFDALFMWPAFFSMLQPESENFFDKQDAGQKDLVTFEESMVKSESEDEDEVEVLQPDEEEEKKPTKTGMGKYRVMHLQKKRMISEKRRAAKQMQMKAIQEKGLEKIRAEKKEKAEKIRSKQVHKWNNLVGSRSSGRISEKVETEKEETVCGVAKQNLKVKSLNMLDRVIHYKKRGSNIRQAVAKASMKGKATSVLDNSESELAKKSKEEEDIKNLKPFSLLKHRNATQMTGQTGSVLSQLNTTPCPPGYVMVPVMLPQGVSLPISTAGPSSSNSLPTELLQSLMLMPQSATSTQAQPYPVLMVAKGMESNPAPIMPLGTLGSPVSMTSSSATSMGPLGSMLAPSGDCQPPVQSIIPSSTTSTAASLTSDHTSIASSSIYIASELPPTTPEKRIPKKPQISPATASITTLLGTRAHDSPMSPAKTLVSPSNSGNSVVISATENEPSNSSGEINNVNINSASSHLHPDQIILTPVMTADDGEDHSSQVDIVSGEENPLDSSKQDDEDTSHVFVGSVPGQGNTPVLISVPKDSNMTVKELIQMMGNQVSKGDNPNQESPD